MLIDVNVWSGRWPFQRFSLDSTEALAEHLHSQGICRALVSPVETAFHPDPHEYNEPLMAQLQAHPLLQVVPVLNPSLAGWESRMETYLAAPEATALRLLPNYHLYELDHPAVLTMARTLAARGIPLLLQLRLEDERGQYPALQIGGVPVAAVRRLVERVPQLRLACLCAYMAEAVELVQAGPNVWVDLAFVETLDTVAALCQQVPAQRVLFGSHTPFLYTGANLAKLENANISAQALEAIGSQNALQFLSA
jgi:uncharacterized protein